MGEPASRSRLRQCKLLRAVLWGQALIGLEAPKNVMRGRRNNVNILDQITKDYTRDDIPAFNVGDTLRVHVKIVEGQRERIQVFEGYVLKRQHGGVNETFTVRKLSNGIGVEKTFPLHSPRIEKIEVVKRGRVRRAKLNYMRQRTGKAARIRSAE